MGRSISKTQSASEWNGHKFVGFELSSFLVLSFIVKSEMNYSYMFAHHCGCDFVAWSQPSTQTATYIQLSLKSNSIQL